MTTHTPPARPDADPETGPEAGAVFTAYAEGLLAGTAITLGDLLAADVPGDGAASQALRDGFAAATLAERGDPA